MSVKITLTEDRIIKEIEKFLEDLTRPGEALKLIGETLVQSTRVRFSTEKDPDGGSWKPSLRAQRENNRTLTMSGALRKSIVFDSDDKEVIVGSNLSYAKLMHFGNETTVGKIRDTYRKNRRKLKRLGDKQRERSVKVVARPFLGISNIDERSIYDILEKFILND